MTHKHLTEADLQTLLRTPVQEGRTVEYKETLPGASDQDKKEFLADVTSFANTLGGTMYFGIRAESGIPTAICGIPSNQVDDAVQRLDSIVRHGIDPRIPAFHIDPVGCGTGEAVLAIFIPKSWAGPHMVTYKGTSRFFARNSAGKYQLDVDEIRAQFIGAESRTERLRRFRRDRLAQIAGGESVLGSVSGAIIVLHLLPLQMFDSSFALDFAALEGRGLVSLMPIYRSSINFRHNFDGLLTSGFDGDSYVQAFRNGVLEAGDKSMLQDRGHGRVIPSTRFEFDLCDFLEGAGSFLQFAAIEPPIFVGLSVLNARGYYMAVPQESHYYLERRLIDSSDLVVPEVVMASFNARPSSVLKPAFDLVWAAAGWPRSMNYDEAGTWRLGKK
ncbi:MAG TPA: ATP-binding protein [Thermoanaerobaculia bacterium]|nr:ATP-binding protein [Thermoanaerobaculia bacterium]